MEKHFNYVYIITNLVNNKQYVGDHSTNKLNDNYLGSGIALNNAKNKYGKEKFKKEILEFFDTKIDAFNAQEKHINEYNTLTPNGYNISPKGGLHVSGCHSKETIKKIKIGNLGKNKGKHHSKESKESISNGLIGRPSSEKCRENMKRVGKMNKGKKRSNKFKENLKNICKGNKEYGKGSVGKIWVFNK